MSEQHPSEQGRTSADPDATQRIDMVPATIPPADARRGSAATRVAVGFLAGLAVGIVATALILTPRADEATAAVGTPTTTTDDGSVNAGSGTDEKGDGGAGPDDAASAKTSADVEPDDEDTAASGSAEGPAEGAACTAIVTAADSWEGGFKLDIEIVAGEGGLDGWTVTADLGADATAEGPWRARLVSSDDGIATFVSEDYNAELDAGSTTTFGFNATGPAPERPVLSCAD
ncbi:cellulose binding domain-containing protein [Demequina salsinemoris]|uniref:cellulose binding domain-containing protein n=1 Tax=Demequina salsinemoris TaxID=577470 RepID=UPI0007867AEC|nr:cellulose binding domain-containing protein [Demequina salsinemoris]